MGSYREVKNCDLHEKVRSFEESVSFPGKNRVSEKEIDYTQKRRKKERSEFRYNEMVKLSKDIR